MTQHQLFGPLVNSTVDYFLTIPHPAGVQNLFQMLNIPAAAERLKLNNAQKVRYIACLAAQLNHEQFCLYVGSPGTQPCATAI